MIDYTILYRSTLSATGNWSAAETWDLFISAFNESERVRSVFEWAHATAKYWIIHPEYGLPAEKIPNGALQPPNSDEAEFIAAVLDAYQGNLATASVCLDITGMMRPHVMLFALMLFARGVKKFDALYSEPVRYQKQEHTQFSILPIVNVRPVLGFEGTHTTDTGNDLLVIGSGYDDALIARVAEHKRSARKLQIFGLPSLRPDMYQQNVLQATKAAEAIGSPGASVLHSRFAPANDPFVTADVLKSIVDSENALNPLSNLYLCPLATKPQALGFALYYLTQLPGTASSIVFPFARGYSSETSKGVSRIWKYTVERLA